MPKENKSVPPPSTEEEVFVFNLLKRMGCTGEEAVAYTSIMFKTISEPVLERMDDQYRSLKESIDAKIDAQNTKYNVFIWVMGIGFTLLLAFSFFGN